MQMVHGSNLVPRACDPREGTRGSGIICCRKPGILAKNRTAHSISTANQLPPLDGLSQSLTFLPEDRRLGEQDCNGVVKAVMMIMFMEGVILMMVVAIC